MGKGVSNSCVIDRRSCLEGEMLEEEVYEMNQPG